MCFRWMCRAVSIQESRHLWYCTVAHCIIICNIYPALYTYTCVLYLQHDSQQKVTGTNLLGREYIQASSREQCYRLFQSIGNSLLIRNTPIQSQVWRSESSNVIPFIHAPPIVCLDPSIGSRKRIKNIWNSFCKKTGLTDFLCVFVSPVHSPASWRSGGKKEDEGGREVGREKERPSEVFFQSKGRFCRRSASWDNPSPQSESHQGEHLHCTALYRALPACLSSRMQQHLAEEQVY